MSDSDISNDLFYVSTVGLILDAFQFMFPVCQLIVESLMLFPPVLLLCVLSISVYPSPLVSAAPPGVASIVDTLLFVIIADHPIAKSERKIPMLFLLFGVKISEIDN